MGQERGQGARRDGDISLPPPAVLVASGEVALEAGVDVSSVCLMKATALWQQTS